MGLFIYSALLHPEKIHEVRYQIFPVGLPVADIDLAHLLAHHMALFQKTDDLLMVPIGLTGTIRGEEMAFLGLPGAPGEVHPGVGTEAAPIQILHERPHAEAHGGGDAGGLGEPPVEVGTGVESHDAPHAGAADGGAFPEGNGAVADVNMGLHIPENPLHSLPAPGLKLPEPTLSRIGQILAEPLLTLVAAFDAHQNHGLFPLGEKLCHAPGFAIGGILIPEQIVAVKKVHHGVVFTAGMVILRQPDVQGAVGVFRREEKGLLDQHGTASRKKNKTGRHKAAQQIQYTKITGRCQQEIG